MHFPLLAAAKLKAKTGPGIRGGEPLPEVAASSMRAVGGEIHIAYTLPGSRAGEALPEHAVSLVGPS